MKLTVLIPTSGYLNNAGARIRYRRLVDALEDEGVTLSLVDINGFDPLTAASDVVMISKCYDSRALVYAAILLRRGVKVGVDLFDDYFSQANDGRLMRFRSWLRQLLQLSDFAICSTPAMVDVVRGYSPDLPSHVLSDAAPAVDVPALARTLQRKAEQARSERVLKLAWFGIGDNPYFPVGLSDLGAFSGSLGPLAAPGSAAELTILTNLRSLSADGLTAIRALPLDVTVEEWSERREADLLSESFACFLPVNAQPFSIAKSLNRGLTALAAGCQILSVGYPLYAALDPFIYRQGAELLSDLEAESLRLSPDNAAEFEARAQEIASPVKEAAALTAFLRSVPAAAASPDREPIYLLHGAVSDSAAHEALKSVGGLSIGSPFLAAPFVCDIHAKALAGGAVTFLLGERAWARAKPEWRRRSTPVKRIDGLKYREIAPEALHPDLPSFAQSSLPHQLALYPVVMAKIARALSNVFEPGIVLLSETSPLPFEADLAA